MEKALKQAKDGRFKILNAMSKAISKSNLSCQNTPLRWRKFKREKKEIAAIIGIGHYKKSLRHPAQRLISMMMA